MFTSELETALDYMVAVVAVVAVAAVVVGLAVAAERIMTAAVLLCTGRGLQMTGSRPYSTS